MPLLKPSQSGVKNQQARDDGSLEILMQPYLQQDGSLKQPWNRRPKLDQGIAKGVSGRIRHGVRPVFVQTNLRRITGKPVWFDTLNRHGTR